MSTKPASEHGSIPEGWTHPGKVEDCKLCVTTKPATRTKTCSWFVYAPGGKTPIGSYRGYKSMCNETAKTFATTNHPADNADLCEVHRKELNSLRKIGKLSPVYEVSYGAE